MPVVIFQGARIGQQCANPLFLEVHLAQFMLIQRRHIRPIDNADLRLLKRMIVSCPLPIHFEQHTKQAAAHVETAHMILLMEFLDRFQGQKRLSQLILVAHSGGRLGIVFE